MENTNGYILLFMQQFKYICGDLNYDKNPKQSMYHMLLYVKAVTTIKQVYQGN